MFNLLRMDLYRMKRGKSVYVCFSLLLIATVTMFGLLWLMATPRGQERAVQMGMIALGEMEEARNLLDGVDTLTAFRQIGLDGGFYSLLFGIWVMLFVCMDYQSGFMKNIMALHQNRWGYVGSKIMTAGIVDFFYLAVQYAFVLLMNLVCGNMLPYAKPGDVIFYLAWAWLLTTAFAALVILVCVCTRSVAAGALAAVLLGGGIVVMPLYSILELFHAGGWLKYTIYMSLTYGPSRYTSMGDLWVFVVGAAFLALYSTAAGIFLKKQDI